VQVEGIPYLNNQNHTMSIDMTGILFVDV
jgi:hypothetical protein